MGTYASASWCADSIDDKILGNIRIVAIVIVKNQTTMHPPLYQKLLRESGISMDFNLQSPLQSRTKNPNLHEHQLMINT